MSTKLKFVDNSQSDDEFSFNSVETDELSQNAMGGTEMMKYGLHERIDSNLLKEFQIICSRVRDVDENRHSILWLHDMFNDPEALHLKDAEARKRFDKIVYVSNYQKTTFEMAYGINPSESVVMHNAIEPIEHHEKPDHNDEIRLIYHTTPHRGLDILVPVFEELAKHNPKLVLDVYSSFAIYGWNQRDADYEHLFERCRQHPQINYHGYQPNSVVRDALKKAHIFAFPSIWTETSCIAAMEAMSAGCAIVHPNLGALQETISNFGISYNYNEDVNVHANIFIGVLSAAIEQVGSEQMKNRLAFQKAYADSFYNWETRVGQWNGLLSGILKTKA